jgi:hypothetical protein
MPDSAVIDVSQQKLHDLLAEQAESPTLEYIGDCDLAERRDIVELATEVGAMAAQGGWIVVGVDDRGVPTGQLDARKLRLFDDATLRDKLAKYLPSVELRSSQHQLGAQSVALVGVAAHPDCAVVFAADGSYEHHGATQSAFRRGDVFVRHGSKSERPVQTDIARIRSTAIERARLWQNEVPLVEQAILELRQTAEAEQARYADNRIGIYRPTTVPTLRKRLCSRPRRASNECDGARN